jgi:6-phosphogluconolactonase
LTAVFQSRQFNNKNTAVRAAVESIIASLSQALSAKGQATLGVCGGSSAELILPILSEAPISWSLIRIVLVDDRWVSLESEHSNESLVRKKLLQNRAADAELFSLKTDHKNPEDALAFIHDRFETLQFPLDTLLVSMGADGHIASLFPGGTENQNDKLRVVASTAPVAPCDRISLSPRVIRESRHIVLPVLGVEKRDIFDQAAQPGPASQFPVRHALFSPDSKCDVFLSP